MATPQNYSALLNSAGEPLKVTPTPFPIPDPDSIIIHNHAIALNPLDTIQSQKGVYIKSFPACIGSDVAGTVHSIGSNVTRFKPGDRVVGHAWSLLTGRAQDGAFAAYSNVPEGNAAVVPESVAFREAVVVPMAVDTAACGLFTEDGMGLSFPGEDGSKKVGVVVVYGASSSVGSMAVQLARAAGYAVVGIAGAKNRGLVEEAGAEAVFDYGQESVVQDVIEAVGDRELIGIYDSIGTADSHKVVVPVLQNMGKGVLCSTKLVPEGLPTQVKVKRMFGIGKFSFPLWQNFINKGLESGALKCLPKPVTMGHGLERIQEGLTKLATGVSGQKLVVEL